VAEVNQIRGDTTRIIERQDRFMLPEPVIEGDFRTELDDSQQPKDGGEQADNVVEFIRMIQEATTQQEIDRLFKSNNAAINALTHKEQSKIIEAKHKRETEIEKAA